MNPFIQTITTQDPNFRDRSFDDLAQGMSAAELLAACEELDSFRRSADNLYERVRATCFLYAAYRFHLMDAENMRYTGVVPYSAFKHLLARRFEEAITDIKACINRDGSNAAAFSALATSYHQLTFQILTDQVRHSVRATKGNQWMFRVGHSDDHTLRVRPELLIRKEGAHLYPILTELTPVRLDLSHSGWSDIFFLGMDFPEGARVINISIDLGVHGRDQGVSSPIQSYFRVIPEPIIRLTSVDLNATKDIADLKELFNFGNDYLSLLKAGVIASGLVPPSFEGTEQPLSAILAGVAGRGMGVELATNVGDIPKGSRLAVSTNLLAGIISLLMRATGQIASLEGQLSEIERRLVASRAILGEWLGGSGGGWQDSGGIWPGMKLIQGAKAEKGDPEYGISAGRLLPQHSLLDTKELAPGITERLAESLVLIHGGLAQNVGPILEMVTERYLLRKQPEWQARLKMRSIFDNILTALKEGSVRDLALATTANWEGPLKTIIPWITNDFTETIIARARQRLGADFWGFLMLGGMSGGGMAMFVEPKRSLRFRDEILKIMHAAKRELEDALPFAIEPLVYNFRINNEGSVANLKTDTDALMPGRYYAVHMPLLAKGMSEQLTAVRRAEFDYFVHRSGEKPESFHLLQTVVSSLFRMPDSVLQLERQGWESDVQRIKRENGFDSIQHEQLRADLRGGRIGLARNRLPVQTDIADVKLGDVQELSECAKWRDIGEKALYEGRVAVMSLAGGMGTRWTRGAGVVKTINPFFVTAGKHRSFLETHLAKTRRKSHAYGVEFPHIISTSYLTHRPITEYLERNNNFGWAGPVYISPGRSICQRLIPMTCDLIFLWEEMPQAELDEQKQKVRDASRLTLMEWARAKGEGSDYTDNLPVQRFSPPGHWYEVSNLLRNGTMMKLLDEHPQVETIMLHNIDTMGVDLDSDALGWHLSTGSMLTYEVVPRRIEDRGGGLARVNGQLRLLEGLAQPKEEVELQLQYYSSMTTWIQVDALLSLFGLSRQDLRDRQEQIADAVRKVAHRLPTYVTIKDVKYRWGHGQEDIYPVTQFEKLWGDMTTLSDVSCGYLAVPRLRGQQLKDPDELDAWTYDGSKDYVESICEFT